MKVCPYCAEEIQEAAIVCRWCGRDLAPDAVSAVSMGLDDSVQEPTERDAPDHIPATGDTRGDAAAAAYRAKQEIKQPIAASVASTVPPSQTNTIQPAVPSDSFWGRYKEFIIYGALMAVPLPFIGWLWLGLGLRNGYKRGWPQGAYGFVFQLVLAFGLRMVLGFILIALDTL